MSLPMEKTTGLSINFPIEQIQLGNITEGRENHSTNVSAGGHFSLAINFVVGLYWCIGVVGILGNMLIIYIVLHDRRLRSKTMNLFLLNLAFSDLLIMVIGVEEMALFVANRGWLFSNWSCKFLRSGMVVGCYCSVLTLTSVCMERYVATVYPMKAQSLCTRSRVKFIICLTWLLALASGVPTFYFLTVLSLPVSHGPGRGSLQSVCLLVFNPHRDLHLRVWVVFRSVEIIIFYLLPLVVQIVSYSIIGRTLFVTNRVLRGESRRPVSTSTSPLAQRRGMENLKAFRARQRIVQMLVVCVLVYFTCYSPTIVPIAYHLITQSQLSRGHIYQVITLTMAYANSAANPILYTVFSDRYRSNFRKILCFCHRLVRQQRPQLAEDQLMANHVTISNSKGTYINLQPRVSTSTNFNVSPAIKRKYINVEN